MNSWEIGGFLILASPALVILFGQIVFQLIERLERRSKRR